MPTINRAQVATDPATGTDAAWVNVVTSPQGRLQSATLNVLPGYTCAWFLVDDTGTRYDGALTNPAGSPATTSQTWNVNNLGLTSYSFGLAADRA